jgi:phosphoserine phosphatase
MDLMVQGADIETIVLKEIAKAAGASGIEQVRPDLFRMKEAKRVEGIAGLCSRHGLEWTFVDAWTHDAS